MEHMIAFPGLGIHLTFNSVAFSIFGKEIFWYGIIIAVGFLLAATYACMRAKQFHLDENHLIDYLFFAVPVAIISARLYYVAFEWDQYKDNLVEIIAIWKGGIAIYGAILGAILTAAIFCKVKNINLLDLLDIGSLSILIGQFIGRWGNFANAEAFGSETNMPWRMVIGTGSVGVHPTFLYESIWNLIGFVLLHFYAKHRKFKGELFLLYVLWYGIGRGLIEGLRTDSLYLFGTGLRVSQLLAIASAVIALAVLVYQYKFKKERTIIQWTLASTKFDNTKGEGDHDNH